MIGQKNGVPFCEERENTCVFFFFEKKKDQPLVVFFIEEEKNTARSLIMSGNPLEPFVTTSSLKKERRTTGNDRPQW